MVDINDLTEKVQEVANNDNVITDEEQILLDEINNFIRQYKLVQEDANEDGIVDEEEKSRLQEMRKGILEGAWVTAFDDGFISDDESDIISTVYEFLKNLKIE